MGTLLFIVSVGIGFIAGSFLAFPMLIVLTIISLIFAVIMCITCKEIAELFAMAFIVYAGIGNIVMWLTYYNTTGQTWFGLFLKTYILR